MIKSFSVISVSCYYVWDRETFRHRVEFTSILNSATRCSHTWQLADKLPNPSFGSSEPKRTVMRKYIKTDSSKFSWARDVLAKWQFLTYETAINYSATDTYEAYLGTFILRTGLCPRKWHYISKSYSHPDIWDWPRHVLVSHAAIQNISHV